MDNQTDLIIINNVLAGNTAAYSVLVNRYRNMVFTLAYNIILNREDAEEVAQDAFVKAFTALHTFKNQSAFSTWLYRIVVNTSLNKKKLQKHFFVDITETELSDEYDYIYPLLQQLESKDQKKYVLLAINNLQEAERICITMHYLNELSVNEIHELTALTTANIKVLLHRGRKHLYEKLNVLLKAETGNLI